MSIARTFHDASPHEFLLGDTRIIKRKLKSPLTINGVTKRNCFVEYTEVLVEENGFSSHGMPDFCKWVPLRWN